MAIAPVLKTGVRKDLGVRIPRPPSRCKTGIQYNRRAIDFIWVTIAGKFLEEPHMPLRERKQFSDSEMIAAFSFILPPDRAREEGLAMNAMPDFTGFETASAEDLRQAGVCGPRSYDGDLLDLLSLVSDSCAERAWRLMGVSPATGRQRREDLRKRLDAAR